MMDVEIEVDIIIPTMRWLEVLPEIENDILRICKETLVFTTVTSHVPQLELSVTLADDRFIHDLNSQYRQKDAPTNVLSFPNIAIIPPQFHQIAHYNGYALLGDVVLSLDTVEREAKEQQKPLTAHITHLVVHGILHLLGYDHENDAEAEVMEQLEINILAHMGISSPYAVNQAPLQSPRNDN